jgi:hypothetical protein
MRQKGRAVPLRWPPIPLQDQRKSPDSPSRPTVLSQQKVQQKLLRLLRKRP